MRVISMQGKEVWDILRREKVYHAELDKCREGWSYKDDICDARVPIWCWAYPDLSFHMMCNGQVLEYLRCEMSLGQEGCWDNFLMFEIEIQEDKLKSGKTHNACAYVKVFYELTLKMVKAVYSVRDTELDDYGWYFKVITPIYNCGSKDVITTEPMDCRYWDKIAETYTDCFSEGIDAPCLKCGKVTRYMMDTKHFCSLDCMFRHKYRFIQQCTMYGLKERMCLLLYSVYSDKDFENKDVPKRLSEIAALKQ